MEKELKTRMKTSLVICLFMFSFCVHKVNAKECPYSLSDEDEKNSVTLRYWQQLEDLTFEVDCSEKEVELTCPNDVRIRTYKYNCTDDSVWNTRFKLYNEGDKNLQHCLCEIERVAGNAEFNHCMEVLRQQMLVDLLNKWEIMFMDEVKDIVCNRFNGNSNFTYG